MVDLLVPFSCLDGRLPAGLPTSAGGVLPLSVSAHNPRWLGCSVDLSAPPLDADGEPTRLDALEWGVKLLLRRLAPVEPVHSLGIRASLSRALLRLPPDQPDMREALFWYRQWLSGGLQTPGGADFLAGVDLTGPDAPRAFVAAALRARIGLEVSRG